ncbi:MAG: prolyl aminopeptidase [Bdellovibrionaceae bacterium]|jgi:proline iminopeptidase|nr:prolyl aminopeptidase [Pseudobdellovibrionaceae bacterium]
MYSKDLYPIQEPYRTHRLQVSSLHNLYVEEVGNPEGIPIVFLHGGPGGGIEPKHRGYFNPQKFRVILFDQRGCGQSTPFAEIEDNTTWDLVADIETIRQHLGIKTWWVFGGSWGSTLALAYATKYPQLVNGLILRGIFLCRPRELSWFYQEGASRIFPDFWENYWNGIPATERGHMIQAYYKRLTHPDESVRLEAARCWSQWEMATSYLLVDKESIAKMDDPAKALPFARIECHYFINNAFFPHENYLLDEAEKHLQNKPITIVQGRYDIVCPMESAWELHKRLPKSKLIVVPDAGHSAGERGIRHHLVDATDAISV